VTDEFNIVTKLGDLPVVTLSLKDSSLYTVFDRSEKSRQRGWIVPSYRMPPNIEEIAVLRIVVPEGFSRDMADMFLEHILRTTESLQGYRSIGKSLSPNTWPPALAGSGA
jgi:glutamate decarboxylase